MKTRSAEECFEVLQSDSSWRKKELSFLRSQVENSSQINVDTVIRAATVITYAHWEGFVKTSAYVYKQYINTCLSREQVNLTDHFQNLLFWNELRKSNVTNVHRDPSPLLQCFSRAPYTTGSFPDELIDTGSNLNSQVLKRLSTALDLNYSAFALKDKLIDEKLLRARNEIAHGDRGNLSKDDFLEIEREVRELIELFQYEIEECVLYRSFSE